MIKYLRKVYALLRDNFFIVKKVKKIYINKIRSQFKNDSDISIICSNCIGGIIYNNLGLKFMSPTINLYMSQKDFLKFVIDLEYYINQDLQFFRDDYYDCPVAYLGDDDKQIILIFLHYKTESEAINKWNERKRRINYDNMYLMMSDRDGITYDDLLQFGEIPCKRKIIFTYKDYNELPYAFKLNSYKGESCVGHYQKKGWHGFCEFEMKFNFAKWLSGEENFKIDNFLKFILKA